MFYRWLLAPIPVLLGVGIAIAEEPVAGLLREIKAVGREGRGSPAARAAWEKLVRQGPEVLPQIVEAMGTSDTVAANWLRTAFDRIVETEIKKGGKQLGADVLMTFARDAK